MLMVIIFTWEKDMVIQQAESMQQVKDLKRRLDNPNTEFIIHDSNFLFPLKFDHATRQLMEDEIIEWKHTEVYPALLEEGKMLLKNGTYKYIRNDTNIKPQSVRG
jgi:hypothetical protein